MRMLVLILVVANAAFFTWRFNEQVEAKIVAAKHVTPLSASTPTLKLVGELDELPPLREAPKQQPAVKAARDAPTVAEPIAVPEEAPVVETAPAPAATPSAPDVTRSTGTPSGMCVHIGPFATVADADRMSQWLEPRTTTLQRETTSTTKRQLFWVYLEPKSDTEAKADMAKLKRQGVSDYLLINRNGLKNAISLGVFSNQDAVNRRLAEMTKKGYSPLVIPRLESTDLYWLNAEFATGYDNTGAIPPDLRGNAGVEQIECTRVAGTAASPEA